MTSAPTTHHAQLVALAAEFWHWRVRNQPDSYDDITRVARPRGWLPDWSAQAVAERRSAWREFDARLRALRLGDAPVPVQVDARLLGSALARVRWELDLVRGWQVNPCFYLDQSLVPVYNRLLAPPPFDDRRAADIVRLLGHVPQVLRQAEPNLAGHLAEPFAQSALRLLDAAAERLRKAMRALGAVFPADTTAPLGLATDQACRALDRYRNWLSERPPKGNTSVSVGERQLRFFLHRVALLPHPVEHLRTMARLEYERATAAETQCRARLTGRPEPSVPADAETQMARQRQDEKEVRRFLARSGLLELPPGLRHYRNAPMPDHLEPLGWLGVPHHTGENTTDDALRYVPEPHPALPYFQLAEAHDPRVGIAHEGVHAWQLALARQHPNPVRRHFYDSVPHEGTAFYTEELLLTAGLFEDAPHSALFLYNAMRLRALRVEVDTGLALGSLSLGEAADRLAQAVPMDRPTAWEETVFFAGNPGQGLSYQAGKAQIRELLAACVEREKTDFSLLAFHRRLWRESAVPFALQRWELLGLRDQLDEADRLADEDQPSGGHP